MIKNRGSNLRSLFELGIEGISDGAFLSTLHGSLHKLIVNLVLDKDTRPGAADLALVKEQSKVTLFHRLIHCNEQRLSRCTRSNNVAGLEVAMVVVLVVIGVAVTALVEKQPKLNLFHCFIHCHDHRPSS